MKTYQKSSVCLLLTLALFCLPGLAKTDQRGVYEQARNDISRGNWARAEQKLEALDGYPLQGYLRWALLRKKPSRFEHEAVKQWLADIDGQVLADRVRHSWLMHLAANKRWKAFLEVYRDDFGVGLRCDYVAALHHEGQLKAAERWARKLWLSGRSQPSHCDDVIYRWLAQQEDRRPPVLARLELAMAEDQLGLSRFLMRRIDNPALSEKLLSTPGHLLELESLESLAELQEYPELVPFTLRRLASRDYKLVHNWWYKNQDQLGLNKQQSADLRQHIARQMLADQDPDSYSWLVKNDPRGEDHYLLEWRARVALRDQQWERLRKTINLLPEDLRESPRWLYWSARAAIELRDPRRAEIASRTLHELADQRGYYPFLAAELMGRDYAVAGASTSQPEQQALLLQRKDVQRALELHQLGDAYNANREWYALRKRLDESELNAAAQLAHEFGWHHQAIFTAAKAGEWDDIELRFPMPWQDRFLSTAKHQELEPEWLYAVARQESAFNPKARSHANARGLLQMLPGTLASLKPGRGVNALKLYEPDISIDYGGRYLSQLFKDFNGNRVLATAAYNAGPARIKRVLKEQAQDMPADIWIETLPYSETRQYVQRVLAYSVIYRHQLGQTDGNVLTDNEQLITKADAG